MSEYKKEGKAPLELLSPDFLREIAKALEIGEKKHADNHYLLKGVPITKVIGAAMRHLTQLQEENIDEDTGIYHTGLAAACLQIIDCFIKDPTRYGHCDDRRFNKLDREVGALCHTTPELQKFTHQVGDGGNT